MRELSRVNLFTWTRDLLNRKNMNTRREEIRAIALEILTGKDPSKTQVSVNDLDNEKVRKLIEILDFNIDILNGIEEQFLVENEAREPEFKLDERLEKNILEKYMSDKKKSDTKKTPKELFNDVSRYKYVFDSKKNPYERFDHLLNFLNTQSNKGLTETKIINESNLENEFRSFKNFDFGKRIFVSHAYDDRLYTFCLFLYLIENGILAYVDWIFCGELKNGVMIKRNLSEKLDKSDQLLFIRTNNSELRSATKGNKNKYDIKGWCAWEIGEFYHQHQNNDQFALKIYNSDDKSNGSKKAVENEEKRDIKILDDLKELISLENGELQGVWSA